MSEEHKEEHKSLSRQFSEIGHSTIGSRKRLKRTPPSEKKEDKNPATTTASTVPTIQPTTEKPSQVPNQPTTTTTVPTTTLLSDTIDLDIDDGHFLEEEEEELPQQQQEKKEKEQVILGGRVFEKAIDLQAYIHLLIHETYKVDQQLNAEDFKIVRDLLNKHPHAAEKIGCGVEAFSVSLHPSFNNRCIMLIRKDGTSEDFSSLRCIEACFKLRIPSGKANRNVVEIPNIIVKLICDYFPTTPANVENKQPETSKITAINGVRQKLREIVSKAAGEEKSAILVDLLRSKPIAFVRMKNSELAAKAVLNLKEQGETSFEVAAGWTAKISNPEITKGDDEKAFWERAIKMREISIRNGNNNYQRRPLISSQQQHQSQSQPSQKQQNTNTETNQNPAAVNSAKQVLPAKAPRVTPTEGQTKRPATMVGTAGKPPVVKRKSEIVKQQQSQTTSQQGVCSTTPQQS